VPNRLAAINLDQTPQSGIGEEKNLSNEVLFNLRNRVLGQVLVDLGDYSISYIYMESMPQIGEGTRRGSNDESFDIARAHQLLQRRSHTMGKSMCLELVPIRRLHTGAAVRTGPLEGTSRTIAALFSRGRVFVRNYPFGFQIGMLFVAGIAQE
jgi:hypothetical protein